MGRVNEIRDTKESLYVTPFCFFDFSLICASQILGEKNARFSGVPGTCRAVSHSFSLVCHAQYGFERRDKGALRGMLIIL